MSLLLIAGEDFLISCAGEGVLLDFVLTAELLFGEPGTRGLPEKISLLGILESCSIRILDKRVWAYESEFKYFTAL